MAPKVSQLLFFIFLLFLGLSSIGYAKREMPSEIKKQSSSFEFIKELKGCHKGIKTKGIQQLKDYLQKFGYLESLNLAQETNDDLYDEALESAIKTYQQNYHIQPTGKLDATTVSKMITPRCGVPDIINGTNTMQARKSTKRHDSSSKSIHTVSNYAFFPREPKWPPSKTELAYGFLPNILPEAVGPVASAFQKWASVTQFTFSQTESYQNADIVIGFMQGDHGDGAPFDGPLGILAHAFAPTDGKLHFDADENWSVGSAQNAFDLESVALHEIGHILGLGHSLDETAVMHSGIGLGEIRNVLQPDDIQGIQALYEP